MSRSAGSKATHGTSVSDGATPTGPSRRSFLKGVGIAASVAGLPVLAAAQNGADEAPPGPKGLTLLGRGAREIALTINGELRRLTVEPRTTLLDALRTRAGLTGAKEVCDRGACGGCTVLLDGVAVNGCMTFAMDAEGRAITTVEGVAADPKCAPMIDAFCAHDGAQCGYCIPGFVVRSSELLADNPKPTFDEVRDGLAGNLCRCGTYSKIFDALVAAGGGTVARLAGNDVALENERPRVDVRAKVTGAAKYASDQYPDGMLWARFIRFPYGAGRVVSSDLDAARAIPGVLEVEMGDRSADASYVGARLGHIVAESRDAMEDALEALALKVRAGDVRTDPNEFYRGAPDLPPVSQKAVDGVLERSAAVIEATYITQVQTHSALETHGGMIDHRGDSVTAWGSTQGTFAYREGLANPARVDASKIEVICEYVGGGFGAKFDPGPEGALAARMSRKFKRPCRYFLDRREEHLDTGNRPGSIQYMKIGADEKGKILGGRIHAASIVGFQNGGGGANNPMCYEFGETIRTDSEITLSSGLPRAFRAPGHPQGCFAYSSMMDELAAAVGIDPVAIRKLNETSDRRRAQLDRGAALIGWDRRHPDGADAGRHKRGLGVAASHWHFWPTRCQAEADIFRSGRVEVRSGVQDIGTGTFTVVADVAAHHLGLDRTMIDPKVGRSSYPEGPGSGGSVTARSVAPAVRDACDTALDALAEEVAALWKTDRASVAYEKGTFSEKRGDRRIAWKEACAAMRPTKVSGSGSLASKYQGAGETDATQFAEVEVDTHTGIVRVLKIVAVQASGQFVNRLTAENQVCGGVVQGISYALFEDRILDRPTGGMVNANLEWYKIAGSLDIPPIVAVLDWNERDTGVRSIGEPATIPTAGAIANAVANATGARVRALPITPDRVLAALATKGARS